MWNTHSDTEKETCQFCEKSIFKQFVKSHLETHHRPKILKTHKILDESERRDFTYGTLKCEFCEKTFEEKCGSALKHQSTSVNLSRS